MNSVKILQASKLFYKLAQSNSGMTPSSQSGDLRKVIVDAGLWGGVKDNEFDVKSPVAQMIFKSMDNHNFHGKLSTEIVIDKTLKVTIISSNKTLDAAGTAVLGDIKRIMELKMSQALKKSKIAPPAEAVTIPWLIDVG